jgi:DNA-binding NarL/FixJ family response regulator
VETPISVLLIDTHRVFLNIIVRLFTDYYGDELQVVGTASSYDDALRQAPTLRPRIILLGVGQSMQEGHRLIAQLREAWPEAAVILLGAHDLEMYRQAALAAGASAYLSKDHLNHPLLPTIRQLVSSSASVHAPEQPRRPNMPV